MDCNKTDKNVYFSDSDGKGQQPRAEIYVRVKAVYCSLLTRCGGLTLAPVLSAARHKSSKFYLAIFIFSRKIRNHFAFVIKGPAT